MGVDGLDSCRLVPHTSLHHPMLLSLEAGLPRVSTRRRAFERRAATTVAWERARICATASFVHSSNYELHNEGGAHRLC
eukprot:6206503-Prymnesium_polylepis.1